MAHVEQDSGSEKGNPDANPSILPAGERSDHITMANLGIRLDLLFRTDAELWDRWRPSYFWDTLQRFAGKHRPNLEDYSAELLHRRALETLGLRLKADVAREVARHFASSPERLQLLAQVRFEVVSIVYGSATISIDITGVAQLAEALDHSYPFFERILRQFVPLEILAIADLDSSQFGLMDVTIDPGLIPRAFQQPDNRSPGIANPDGRGNGVAGAPQAAPGLLNLRSQSSKLASFLWIASNLSLIPAVLLMWAVMRETRHDARQQRTAADSSMRAVVEHQWRLLNRRESSADSVPRDSLARTAVPPATQGAAP